MPAARRTTEPSPRDEARALYRRAILRAAEEVFAENDFHAARMNDIAARAQLAVGTIYNHFEHKVDVLAALLDERIAELVATVDAHPDDPEDFAGSLEARITRMLAFVKEHRKFFVLANDYGLFGATRAAQQIFGERKLPKYEGVRPVLRQLVRRGIEQGELAPIDVELLVGFLLGAVKGMDLMADPKARPDEAARQVVSLFLDGARQRPKGKRK